MRRTTIKAAATFLGWLNWFRRGRVPRQMLLTTSLCYCMLMQPMAALAAQDNAAKASAKESSLVGKLIDFVGATLTPPPVPAPPPLGDAAVSRKVPSLVNGRIDGNLRVYTPQSFSFEGGFVVNAETYVVGTPSVTVATNATWHGTTVGSGSAEPSNYTVAINGTSRLTGQIHLHTDALGFPANIPLTVPQPAGTRIVNINTSADLNNIGNWATLKELHVNKSGETITVPPGNYGSFSVTGNSRLNFSSGTYNFVDGFAFASNASIKVTGKTTINLGSNVNANISNTGLLLGDNTLTGDVIFNVLGSSLVVTGNSTIKALVRVPNGTAQITGSSVVHGQVLADTLQILNNSTVEGDIVSSGPADTAAPTVSITSPANNFATTSTSITVSGSAADAGTNASGIFSVTVNNAPASYDVSTGNWTLANVPLSPGPNTITAQAMDNAGNVATPQTITVNLQTGDNTPPTVTISSPTNNFSTASASITVSGTATDPGTNASGVTSVVVNGVTANFDPATGNWTAANVPLPNIGPNQITATATDQAGNTSPAVAITVNRQPPPDTTPPVIGITSPTNGSSTEAASITVSGTVADSGQYASGVAQVTVNGAAATLNTQAGTWTISVPLSTGSNTIEARAFDNAGNQSTPTTISVNRIDTTDRQAPTITISSPANNSTTPNATITVTGTAIDEGTYATGVRQVLVNGQAATYDPATHIWTATGVPVSEGANTIRVIADDNSSAHNSAEASINVNRRTPDTQPPTVTISALTSDETYDAAIALSGTARDEGLNASGVQSVTVNGQAASYNATTGVWSVNNLPLTYGDNSIVVTATDGAPTANQGQANVHVTRLRIPPPQVSVRSPGNGATLAATSITVAGSVSSLGTTPTVTVNGQSAVVSGGEFAIAVALQEGANSITVVATDSLAQQTQVSVSVIRDMTPPTVAFSSVPPTVQPGRTYDLVVDASDNLGIADVQLSVNGQFVSTATTSPYQFTFAVPATYTAGTPVVLSAVARDLTNTTAVATAQTQVGGPSGISGYVFDDTTGYTLSGVKAQLNSEAPVTTDDQGVFSLVSSTQSGVVRLMKDGYTPIERLYTVPIGESTALFDARLTPLDSHANLFGGAGGVAEGDNGRLRLSFPAGTLSESVDVRVTNVSPQGLANLLPYGWSPVPGAVVDLRTAASTADLSQLFPSPVSLTVSPVAALSSATPLTLARYDESSHRWIVIATNLFASAASGGNGDGVLTANVSRFGQYAFLVADSGATAPPAAIMGQPLTTAPAADSAALDAAQASAFATPRAAVFSASTRSTISFFAAAPAQLPSGVSIEASFGETYNLLGGRDSVLVDRPAQDFVLYAYPAVPDQPKRLGAFFIAKPTRTDFSITDLFNANVHVDIRSGRQTTIGTLIDSNGGSVRAGNGSQLTIPPSALSGQRSVFFNDIPVQQANLGLPTGYEIVGAFDLDVGSGGLNSTATISVPGVNGDLSRIVVARVITVSGQRCPKVVARAIADISGKLNSTIASPAVPAGVQLAGILTSGRYLFIRVPQPFGYVKGNVTDAANGNPLALARVSSDKTPFIDVTGADGQFVVIGSAGTDALGLNQISAASLTTDATGKANASLSDQDAVANTNIAVTTAPLQVEAITPAANAQNMIATTPVTVTFNKPVSAASVTGSSFSLSTAAGNPVLGNITVLAGSRVVVFTPAASLAASTTYRVSISQSVRDIYGHALGVPFSSSFSTAATVTVSNRLRPEQIVINYPDANGISTISIPAQTVPEGSTLLVVNTTTGSTLSTVAGTGALTLQIEAHVGDEITLIITQPDGTQYRTTQAAYRRADGFLSVGSNGGAITSDDGQVLLNVPAGAISGQADIKLSRLAESAITIPREGDMDPASVPFGAGVRINATGNFTNTQELHLEVAAPPTATEGQRVAFMRPAKFSDASGEHDVWEVVTSGKVEGGKFKTMSPPFIGATIVSTLGNNDYDVFMPRNYRAVTGKVTEIVPDHAPKPLAGVTCRIGTSQVIAMTAANGRFGTLDFTASAGDAALVNATDTLGRTQTATATPYISTDITETGLNGLHTLYAAIQFPSSVGLPETLPAVLQLEGRMLDLQQGQPDTLQEVGRVVLGSHVEIKVTTTPDVQQTTGQLLMGGTTVQQLVWKRQPAAAGTGVLTTDFTVNGEGSYSVVVTTFTQANVVTTKGTASFGFVALQNPNQRPSLEGPPRVVKWTPAEFAQQVSTGTRVHLEFSEPVKNLVPGTTVLLTDVATQKHIGGTITSGGLPITATSPNISNIDFQPATGLEANKQYAIEVTTAVTDTENNPLDQNYVAAGDTDAQPFRSTFTTFKPVVLTNNPPTQTTSYRVATAGDLAITVEPTTTGSNLRVYDLANPETPTVLGNKFVPFFATAYDLADADQESDAITVETPAHKSYQTIAAVLSYSVQDTERPINLWIYSLDEPTAPELIGVSSLKIPRTSPSYPMYVKIHHKRAYIGNSGRDSVEVVDLEEAVRTLAESPDPTQAWFPAVFPGTSAGFDQEAKKQRASYQRNLTEIAPVYSLSVMDQAVPKPGGGFVQSPVAYVASNRLQLLSFDLNSSYDGQTTIVDPPPQDGIDDRLIGTKDLSPSGFAIDVRAVPRVTVGGQTLDLALLLGVDRLWLFNATNPRDPQAYASRSFVDLGLPAGAARRMDVEGTLAYVMFADRVAVIDFSDPAHLFVSAVIDGLGSDLRWISVRDGFVYTLDMTTGSDGITTSRLRSSIGAAAAVAYVHGKDKEGSSCTNPVIISRNTDEMVQPAEVIFKLYGHDAPKSSQVIIRKETTVADQTTTLDLATLTANLEAIGSTGVVIGRASWGPAGHIDSAALYTAEVIIDAGLPTEFRARRVPIVFSHLIDQFQSEFAVQAEGGGHFAYLLGGNALISLTVNNRPVNFDSPLRTYGLHYEPIKLSDLGSLAPGRYQFTFTASLQGDYPVSESAQGVVTVGDPKKEKRQPGSIVVGGVELETGNLGLSNPDIPEIKNRGLSLSFTRHYNSAGSNSWNTLGYGWSHNYQMLLTHQPDFQNPDKGVYTVDNGDGSRPEFKEANLGKAPNVNSEAPFHDTLRKNADNSFDYFTKGNIQYHFDLAMEVGSNQLFNLGYMGNLSFIAEPNGNKLTLSYDQHGRLASVTDSANRKLEFTYEIGTTPLVGAVDTGSTNNDSQNCTNKRYLRSVRRRFALAQVGTAWRIIKVTGPGGVEVDYHYDDHGNLDRSERIGGDLISQATDSSLWQYAYDPNNGTNASTEHLLKTVQPPNQASDPSRQTTYEYESTPGGLMVKATHLPAGVNNSYSRSFSTAGVLTRADVIDGRGNVTHYDFLNSANDDKTSAQKTITVTAPRGAVSTIVFDGYGGRLSETDPEGRQTITHYDSRGNPDSQTVTGAGKSISTSATYDGKFDKPVTTVDGRSNPTSYTLDGHGNVTKIQLPTGRTLEMDYAANGDLQRMVDQYGFATTYQYDPYGNPTVISREAGNQATVVMQNAYDDRSRLLSSTDTISPSVENAYDALDRIVSQTITDPSAIRDTLTTTLAYLPEGQVRQVSQTGGQTLNVTNTYDGLNRLLTAVETPSGAGPFTREYSYDNNSNPLSETDRRGVTTTRTYDALNFVTTETVSGPFGQSLATMSATEIDRVGNPLRVLDLYGQETSFEYDGLHRLIRRNLPGNFHEEIGYDDNGNVILQKDRNQRPTVFVYDPINRRTRLADPAGRVTTWSYLDASHTTVRQSDPQGLTETLQADGLGRIVRREVKFGAADYITTNQYDGRSVQTTDPRGVVSVKQLSAFGETGDLTVNGAAPAYRVRQSYGPFGGLKHSVDANGRENSYTLDGLNRPTQISRAGGFSEAFTYDGDGNVLSHTDLRGVTSQMTYDNLGRPLATLVHDGTSQIPVLSIAYQDQLSKETRTDANGHATELEYDGLRRLKTVKNAMGRTRTLQYDGMDLVQETDFKGAVTSYLYDALDRVTQVTDRARQVTNIANSDVGGYTKTTTDRRGHVTVETYDPLQRLQQVVQGGLPLVSYEYDGNNNRAATNDGRGNRTSFIYDALNRVTRINRPANLQSETFAYDAAGNVITYNDGAGGDITQTFDELNHLKTRADSLGNTTNFQYDGGGLLLGRTEPKGAQYRTAYVYNALGSLKQVTDAKGGLWKFDYDGAQNLIGITDALNRAVGYSYDTLDRLTQVAQPQSLTTAYGYDDNSNRTSITDAKGQQTSIGYDSLDRMQAVDYDQSVTAGPRHFGYTYDPEGNLTGINETALLGPASPTTRNYTRSYDERNRLTAATDANNRTVRFGYDAANNVTSMTDATSRQTSYIYDALNRVQSVTLQNPGATIDYQWQADGLLKQVTYPSGMQRQYGYDAADRLTSVNNHVNTTESDEFTYGYDANSNRTSETRKQNGNAIRSITYDYDLSDRLTAANYTAVGQRPANPAAGQSVSYTEGTRANGFDYDAVGNRKTSTVRDNTATVTLATDNNGVTAESRQASNGNLITTTAQFDDLNRLTRLSSDLSGSVATDYSYDRNGNLTSTSQNNQVVTSYQYDGRDQLRRVLGGGNQELARYDYDCERRRLGKTVGGVSLNYVYGTDQVINEYGDNNQLTNRYDLGAGEVLRAQLGGEGDRYYFSDGQGSITSLAQLTQSPPASLTTRYEYDAWGNYLGGSGASYNSIGYTGQRFDGETGLMPLGNGERYYAPGLGSFIQQDSFAGMAMMAQSMNRYAYGQNNPLRFLDPTGNQAQKKEDKYRKEGYLQQGLDDLKEFGGTDMTGNWWGNFYINYQIRNLESVYHIVDSIAGGMISRQDRLQRNFSEGRIGPTKLAIGTIVNVEGSGIVAAPEILAWAFAPEVEGLNLTAMAGRAATIGGGTATTNVLRMGFDDTFNHFMYEEDFHPLKEYVKAAAFGFTAGVVFAGIDMAAGALTRRAAGAGASEQFVESTTRAETRAAPLTAEQGGRRMASEPIGDTAERAPKNSEAIVSETTGEEASGGMRSSPLYEGMRQPKPQRPTTADTLLENELEFGEYGAVPQIPRDQLTPHHMPSAEYMAQKAGISPRRSLAMNVEAPSIGGRHARTETFGRSPFMDETPRTALARDILDLRRIYRQDQLYGSRARQAFRRYIQRSKETFPELFEK